ncbi:MAG: hypothetical protein QOJ64_2024 [Acidobacteriota bacterium]|jgi:hypothetical protein|nr:hypothetical protein [Acidobacteriota bacterium]
MEGCGVLSGLSHMAQRFTQLIQLHEDSIVRTWAEAIYAEPRTRVASMLSYEQLVDHLPDLIAELSKILDQAADDREIEESAKHLRAHPQVRFQQGVLIDEVARELTIFREVFNEFLWKETVGAGESGLQELRSALKRSDYLIDELIVRSVVIYAACMRPAVETRSSSWPPPRRRPRDPPGE